MKTRSGTLITPWSGVPTLEDVAWGLMRAPRFGGHTEEPWSVAEHSLCAQTLARFLRLGPVIEMHALVHDQHESVTSDVPSPWKPEQLRQWQHDLDRRFYTTYNLPWPTDKESALVSAIDLDLLLAEAMLVGPTGAYETISEEHRMSAAPNALGAVKYVQWWLGSAGGRFEDVVYHEMLSELRRAVERYE